MIIEHILQAIHYPKNSLVNKNKCAYERCSIWKYMHLAIGTYKPNV
jgi:hypothetical protein